MSTPDLDEVKRQARELIVEAKEDGSLDAEYWTLVKVRREIERRMSLEEGVLDVSEWKKHVKSVVEATMAEIGGDEDKDNREVEVNPQPVKKGKVTKTDTPRGKNAVSSEKKTQKKTGTKKTKRSESPKRSASVVPSSGDEQHEDAPKPSKPASKAPAKRNSKKAVVSDEDSEPEQCSEPPRKRQKSSGGDEPVKMQDEQSPPKAEPSTNTSSAAAEQDQEIVDAVCSKPPGNANDSGYKSESEMSVLIDEPPKPERKKNKDTAGKSRSEKEPKVKKSKQTAKEPSKDEETIKRLKSLVNACGVRKVWAKEFKDTSKPSDQIRRLKQMLTDLGMSGRMSLEQAKAIRERRELAQELQDVQSFEKAIVSGPTEGRTRKKAQKVEQAEEEQHQDESDEDVGAKPKRRRATARQSIMAFLQDQSDEE